MISFTRERELTLIILANDKDKLRACYPGQAVPKGFYPIGTLHKGGSYVALGRDNRVPPLGWLDTAGALLALKHPVKDLVADGYQYWTPDQAGKGETRTARALRNWWVSDLDDQERQALPPTLFDEAETILDTRGVLELWSELNLYHKIGSESLDRLIKRLR